MQQDLKNQHLMEEKKRIEARKAVRSCAAASRNICKKSEKT